MTITKEDHDLFELFLENKLIKPKSIIQKYTVEEFSTAAENYFKLLSNPITQLGKPFNNPIEAPDILQNIGALLSGLKLSKTMTVLEFAAGTCWLSRYLHQLECHTISCDVSFSALAIGKRLFDEYPIIGHSISKPLFLHFDGYKIDLPDESVDRIICNDGFHHIPNQEDVMSEFSRVLKQGGIAGFSEPGRFHSQNQHSQYEMKNYAVLENDILINEINTIAIKQGFSDIKLKIFGDIEITLEQYNFLSSSEGKTKLNGLFKTANNDTIWNSIINKTIFFLYKGKFVPDSRSTLGLSHTIDISQTHYITSANESFSIPVTITNTGEATWLKDNIHNIGIVKIGTHLYDNLNRLINLDFSRHELTKMIAPGSQFTQILNITLKQPGTYHIAIDMVSEHVCWFENIGCSPKLITIEVREVIS